MSNIIKSAVVAEAAQEAQMIEQAIGNLIKACGVPSFDTAFEALNKFAETMSINGTVMNIFVGAMEQGFGEGGGFEAMTNLVTALTTPEAIQNWNTVGAILSSLVSLSSGLLDILDQLTPDDVAALKWEIIYNDQHPTEPVDFNGDGWYNFSGGRWAVTPEGESVYTAGTVSQVPSTQAYVNGQMVAMWVVPYPGYIVGNLYYSPGYYYKDNMGQLTPLPGDDTASVTNNPGGWNTYGWGGMPV